MAEQPPDEEVGVGVSWTRFEGEGFTHGEFRVDGATVHFRNNPPVSSQMAEGEEGLPWTWQTVSYSFRQLPVGEVDGDQSVGPVVAEGQSRLHPGLKRPRPQHLRLVEQLSDTEDHLVDGGEDLPPNLFEPGVDG